MNYAMKMEHFCIRHTRSVHHADRKILRIWTEWNLTNDRMEVIIMNYWRNGSVTILI